MLQENGADKIKAIKAEGYLSASVTMEEVTGNPHTTWPKYSVGTVVKLVFSLQTQYNNKKTTPSAGVPIYRKF